MNTKFELIINADDFGYSIPVNEAIVQSFRECLISRTSLMANMAGFDHAINLLQSHPSLANHTGIHLNLTEGFPLSEEIKTCPRFCDSSGRFTYDRQRSLFLLSAREQRAVYTEIKAQMDKAMQAGITPSHIDSHHHVHTELAILTLTVRLRQEYGIPGIRLTRNMGRIHGYFKRAYKKMVNGWLKRQAGIACTDYFGDVEDLHVLLQSRSGREPAPVSSPGKPAISIELMVHPLFNEQGELVDYDRKNLGNKLRPLIASHKVIHCNNIIPI